MALGRGEATGELPAAGCRLSNRAGRDRILNIRDLKDRHEFTLMCKDFAQLGQFVQVDNAFRVIKARTPGPYTFILPRPVRCPPVAAPEEEDGLRPDPDHVLAQVLLATLGEPMLTSTLILRGENEPHEELGHQGGARPRGRHRHRGR